MENTHKLQRPPVSTPSFEAAENTNIEEMLVTAHYFWPGTSAEWYVVAFSPDEQSTLGWGELVPDCGEYGFTSMRELEEYVYYLKCYTGEGRFSIPMRVELDEYWDNTQTMGEVLAKRA